jgi:hypothetical protein
MKYSNIAISRALRMIGGEGKNHCSLSLLITISVLLCIIAGIILNTSEQKAAEKEGRKPKPFLEVLGLKGDNVNMKSFVVGMATNFIFGFIDNAGLFFGMDALDPYFPAEQYGAKTQAGIGNTYSDILGSFLGTFIGKSIQIHSGVDETPLIADVVGITLGCIFGVLLPRLLVGDKKE